MPRASCEALGGHFRRRRPGFDGVLYHSMPEHEPLFPLRLVELKEKRREMGNKDLAPMSGCYYLLI